MKPPSTRSSFLFYFLISLLVHIAFAAFLYWGSRGETRSLGLWSGGFGDGRVTEFQGYIDLKKIAVTGDQSVDVSKKETPVPTEKTPKETSVKVKQSQVKKQPKKQLSKKESSPKKTQAQEQQNQFSSGKGGSDTPAGGVGQGLDAKGPQTQSAPHVLAEIRKKIQRKKRYPVRAKERRWQGTAVVVFQIAQSGDLQSVALEKSSGHSALDQAALAAVKKAKPFPYYPGKIRLPLEFRLYGR